ncbi:4'-phosphopantetheinyl transferase superfamily protein [Streptomyces sp. HMX112]|uniref:4'-phosphopantetheinyl transferase superfamily protein n=1 Tax=Streptomyces sp. HMX112 TaxID=3390850 RepID=UPI003A7F97EA
MTGGHRRHRGPAVRVSELAGGRIAVCVLPFAGPPLAAARPGACPSWPRAAERAGGRRALSTALRALGVAPGDLARSATGAPVAPEGTAVSLTHRGRYAVGVAWRGGPAAHRVAGLGVDLEHHGQVPPGALRLLCGEAELAALRGEPSWLDPTRLFAAKEAVFKAASAWSGGAFRPRALPLEPRGERAAVCALPRAAVTGTTGPDRTVCVVSTQVGEWWTALSLALV